MKSLFVLLLLTTLALSLKYSLHEAHHFQQTQKPLTASVSSPDNKDKGVGERVKDSVKNDTTASKPQNKSIKNDIKINKSEDKSTQPQNILTPTNQTQQPRTKPNITKPEDKLNKPQNISAKPQDKLKPEDKVKPTQNSTSKPQIKDSKTEKSIKINDIKQKPQNDDTTENLLNCNNKGRCWMWCGGDQKTLTENKNSFHKVTDGKWCFTTSENSCKVRDDCINQTKCVDNCEARWGQ